MFFLQICTQDSHCDIMPEMLQEIIRHARRIMNLYILMIPPSTNANTLHTFFSVDLVGMIADKSSASQLLSPFRNPTRISQCELDTPCSCDASPADARTSSHQATPPCTETILTDAKLRRAFCPAKWCVHTALVYIVNSVEHTVLCCISVYGVMQALWAIGSTTLRIKRLTRCCWN